MKRIAALALLTVALTGCGGALRPGVEDTDYGKVEVEGTTCVVARGTRAVALDCDWR